MVGSVYNLLVEQTVPSRQMWCTLSLRSVCVVPTLAEICIRSATDHVCGVSVDFTLWREHLTPRLGALLSRSLCVSYRCFGESMPAAGFMLQQLATRRCGCEDVALGVTLMAWCQGSLKLHGVPVTFSSCLGQLSTYSGAPLRTVSLHRWGGGACA